MGFITSQFDYVLGKNLAIMQNVELTGDRTFAVGSKIKDKGIYEITFSYSVRKADTLLASNPHFYIGFGAYVNGTTGNYNSSALVRLAFPNKEDDVHQLYPFQMQHTVWLMKENDNEYDFMCKESSAVEVWMLNINAVAKKIADI